MAATQNQSGCVGVVLKFDLAGGFAVRDANDRAIAIGSRKAQALLAYLAMPPGKAHGREELMALLWSDRAEPQARASLRQALVELRRELPERDPPLLITDRDDITLDPSGVVVDVVTMDRLIDDRTKKALEQAADLYGGDLLQGLDVRDPAFDDWRSVEAERLRRLVCKALEQLAEQQTGDAAIAAAQRLLTLDPLNEPIHRRLMALYAKAGNRPMAIKQYEACRDLLKAELDLEPGMETERLLEAIRRGENGSGKEPAKEAALTTKTSGTYPDLPDKPSIAVLPFDNLSGDPDQEYFSDGITQDIITELSRQPGLMIIARNSSFAYKEHSIDIRQISRELGVRYIVEGSVRKGGNRVRITAQLVESDNGAHIWAERYDRELEDIFAVQDEITASIAGAIVPQLRQTEQERALRKLPNDLTAQDLTWREMWYQNQFTPEAYDKARVALGQALSRDPSIANAHILIAHIEYVSYLLGDQHSKETAYELVFHHSQKALELERNNSDAHNASALAFILVEQWERAFQACKTAVDLAPSSAYAHLVLGAVELIAGDPNEAIRQVNEGMRLSPKDPLLFFFHLHIGEAHIRLRQYKEAIVWLQSSIQLKQDVWIGYVDLVVCLSHLGKTHEAESALAEVYIVRPKLNIDDVMASIRFKDPAETEHFVAGLRKAGFG